MSTEIKYEIKPFQDSPGTPTVKGPSNFDARAQIEGEAKSNDGRINLA